MGASRYSGKGSTSPSRRESKTKRKSSVRSTSAMVEMFELLEEVERCRDAVTSRQADLDSAKKDLERAEQKVSAQINKLDPEIKARFRKMMGELDEKEQDDNVGR